MFLTKEELWARRWRAFGTLLASVAMMVAFTIICAAMFLLWGM